MTIALIAAAMAVMRMLHEVAKRRASSARRAPRARETSAPTGIIRPTLIEIVKNITTVARPTPAVMLGSLSQEIMDARDIPEADIGRDEPRDVDRHRRAIGLHIEAEDQNRVEKHGDDGDGERGIHASLGIARRSQYGGKAHAERHHRIGRKSNPEKAESDVVGPVMRA